MRYLGITDAEVDGICSMKADPVEDFFVGNEIKGLAGKFGQIRSVWSTKYQLTDDG